MHRNGNFFTFFIFSSMCICFFYHASSHPFHKNAIMLYYNFSLHANKHTSITKESRWNKKWMFAINFHFLFSSNFIHSQKMLISMWSEREELILHLLLAISFVVVVSFCTTYIKMQCREIKVENILWSRKVNEWTV